MKLSWRRLRVYVQLVLPVGDRHDKQLPLNDGEQLLQGDTYYPEWQRVLDNAIGRESPSHVQKMSLQEFMKVSR